MCLPAAGQSLAAAAGSTSHSSVFAAVAEALEAALHEDLDCLAQDRGVGVIAAGNFSIMAAVLRHATLMAARHPDCWEIMTTPATRSRTCPAVRRGNSPRQFR